MKNFHYNIQNCQLGISDQLRFQKLQKRLAASNPLRDRLSSNSKTKSTSLK
jgi:hypothetical protein